VEENPAEALRETLRSSRILYGMNSAEIEANIAAKVEQLELELAEERTLH
jgi:ABC-type Na+ transport system ATPase subunit NatA